MIRRPPPFRSMLVLLACVALAAATPASARQATARYRATIETTWSADTHPVDFPSNPHFSRVVGAVHDDAATYWMPGATASDGIEQMAETGAWSILESEFEAARLESRVLAHFVGGNIPVSPGSVSVEFDATEAYPTLTLVTMLAPSPDWFIGVTALDLQDAGGWIASREVDLTVYDAGTDSGSSYTSANADTQPRGTITVLTESPFHETQVVGVLRVERIDATARETGSSPPDVFALTSIHPNPGDTRVEIGIAGRARVELGVYDMLGRARYTASLPAAEAATVDVSAWPPGLYVVRAESAGRVQTRTFVVRR